MNEGSLNIETVAARSGLNERVGESTATVGPITASTTFTYDTVDRTHAALDPEVGGFAYGRNANPTVASMESALAALCGAEESVAFGSGMAAMHGALASVGLGSGDRVVAARDLYGATRSLLGTFSEQGIEIEYVDAQDLNDVENALAPADTRVFLFESIANPLLQVPDISALITAARRNRVITILDNTFASPILYRGVPAGVDLEVQSTTKFLAGHGDVTGGVVSARSSWAARVRSVRTVIGGILSPFEAWLTMRGMRTLAVRMERQCRTAAELAPWLRDQPWIEHAYYPGLSTGEQRSLIDGQFGGRYGALVSARLRASVESVSRFMDALDLITPGTSLGDAASLITCPRLSSHRSYTDAEAEEVGIAPSLVRLSIGLEHPDDLRRDLLRAARAACMPGAPADL